MFFFSSSHGYACTLNLNVLPVSSLSFTLLAATFNVLVINILILI